MKKGIKNFTLSGLLTIFFVFISYNYVFADMASLLKKTGDTSLFVTAEPNLSIPVKIGHIINYVLSFLGVIFIILIIYAGFLWMTAVGDSSKIDSAKEIFKSTIIGLIIILSSYIITASIIKNI